MKKSILCVGILILFSFILVAIDMEKKIQLKKSGWPFPDSSKYEKSKSKRFTLEGISEEFIVQYYVLKEKYRNELFQIEMSFKPLTELRKYTLKGYGVIKLIKQNREIILAYDYLTLFDIGDLVDSEDNPESKFYTGGSAVPVIIIDLDGDGIYESLISSLLKDKNGFFINMQKEVTKYKYMKLNLNKKKLDCN